MENKTKKSFIARVADWIFDPTLYTVLYLLNAVMWIFPAASVYMNYPMKLLFLWGVAVIGYDLVTRRDMFRARRAVWLVLFCAAYAVTILLNRERLFDGAKHMIYNGILFFAVYRPRQNFETYYKKILPYINDMVIVIGLVAAVISVGMYAVRYEEMLVTPQMTAHLGIFYNRLHGVYTSANTGALFSAVTIGLTLINRLLNKQHFKRFLWLYIVNAVFQMLYYSATLSNGGLLAYMALLFSAGIFLLFPYLLRYKKKVVAVLLALVFLGGSYFALQGVTLGARQVMLTLPKLASHFQTPETPDDPDAPAADPDEKDPDTQINFDRVEEGNDLANGRIAVWTAGISAMKHSMLFGIIDPDVYEDGVLIADIDESQMSERDIAELKRVSGYMHNAIIQILVCAGVVGLGLFVIFAFLVAKDYLVSWKRLFRTKYVFPLAAVLSFIVTLLSQAPAEGHLLFNRQDIFAVLFWLYLGVGAQMVDHFKERTADTDLFVCHTPYQVVNVLSLATESDKADVCVCAQFKGADEVAENLKKTGLFENVLLYNNFKTYKNGLVQKAVTLLRLLVPALTLKKLRVGKSADSNYRALYFSYFTPFTDCLKLTNPAAEIHMYEDGIGSYCISDLEDFARTGIFKVFNAVLFNDALTYHAKSLHLNRPACYIGVPYETVAQLPEVTDTAALETVFGYAENDAYADNHFVYLTQPLEETAVGEKAIKVEETLLSACGDRAVLRVHPRQNRERYAAYTLDTAGNLWELECAKQITDSHILVGAFSTAQFTPKMLFNKEPTVIFTHKLYGGLLDTADAMIDILKKMYRDPDKILVPDTEEELRCMLDEVAKV